MLLNELFDKEHDSLINTDKRLVESLAKKRDNNIELMALIVEESIKNKTINDDIVKKYKKMFKNKKL